MECDSTVATPATGLRARLIRSLLFRLLAGVQQAGLTLQEGDELIRFGDPLAPLQARIVIRDPAVYARLLRGGSIAAAESYVAGQWQTPDLTSLIRIMARNQEVLERLEQALGWLTRPLQRWQQWRQRNSLAGARSNIRAHYDLGNGLYAGLLDPWMQYSSAIYPHDAANLAAAQQHKLKTICDKLALGPEDHLLEIGTGWGGLAIFAARHYGCRVTTTTISEAQYAHAREWIAREGLNERITLLKQDYRLLEGQYDKLVSIEMIEAVGHAYLPGFFRRLGHLLKPDGRLLIQAITIDDRRYDRYRKRVDFIQRHIFPGGALPCIGEMLRHLTEQTDLLLVRLQDYGPHYARTLADWRTRLENGAGEFAELGFGDEFRRLWRFYFCYCEGGFSERVIGLVQLEATKPGPSAWSGS